MCEICAKLTIKTLEQPQLQRSGVFIINFEHIAHLFLAFVFLTLNMYFLLDKFNTFVIVGFEHFLCNICHINLGQKSFNFILVFLLLTLNM